MGIRNRIIKIEIYDRIVGHEIPLDGNPSLHSLAPPFPSSPPAPTPSKHQPPPQSSLSAPPSPSEKNGELGGQRTPIRERLNIILVLARRRGGRAEGLITASSPSYSPTLILRFQSSPRKEIVQESDLCCTNRVPNGFKKLFFLIFSWLVSLL